LTGFSVLLLILYGRSALSDTDTSTELKEDVPEEGIVVQPLPRPSDSLAFCALTSMHSYQLYSTSLVSGQIAPVARLSNVNACCLFQYSVSDERSYRVAQTDECPRPESRPSSSKSNLGWVSFPDLAGFRRRREGPLGFCPCGFCLTPLFSSHGANVPCMHIPWLPSGRPTRLKEEEV
jgi:hypothetical protein